MNDCELSHFFLKAHGNRTSLGNPLGTRPRSTPRAVLDEDVPDQLRPYGQLFWSGATSFGDVARSEKIGLLVGAIVVICILGLNVGLIATKFFTEDWIPSAIPTQVQYAGRDYDCPSPFFQQFTGSIGSNVVRGHTIGGGQILAKTPQAGTYILVRDRSRLALCTLSGGF